MHPETADDRLTFLLDFGEECIVTPAAGGPPWRFRAIPDRPARRATELELGEGIAPLEMTGSDPKLLARADDVLELAQGDIVDVPKWRPLVFSVHTIEPDGDEIDFRMIDLLEVER